MRINCPTCDAVYDVPETVLVPGRKLRCARCQNNWAPGGPVAMQPLPQLASAVASNASGASAQALRTEPVAAERSELPSFLHRTQDDTGRPGTMQDNVPVNMADRVASRYRPALAEPEPAARAPHAGLVIGAWVASFALIGALVWASIVWRGPIVRLWPAAARAYAAVGLPAPK